MTDFIGKARALALKSNHNNYRVGAVLVQDSYILACAKNRPPRAPHEYESGLHSVHAEHCALLKSRDDTRGATIYVVVVNRNGNDVCSRPCVSCWSKLRLARVKEVVYSNRGVVITEAIS